MADVTDCCQSVIPASDYVQAAAAKTVRIAHHWLSERPGFRCVCQRRMHTKLVCPQIQRTRQPVVCPYYAGERAECSLCGGHAMTNVSVVSAVTLHSRPQIRERVDVIERSVADVHLAQQHAAVCTALSASEPRRDTERCVTPPSHQRAAWIFNPRCVGNVREQASHLCASFRASISASLVQLTRVLRWIYMTLLLACDITIAVSVRAGACSRCGHSGSCCSNIRIYEHGVIRVLERHDGRTLAQANGNAGVLEVMHPEDSVHSCDKCNGREGVPLDYSSGDFE